MKRTRKLIIVSLTLILSVVSVAVAQSPRAYAGIFDNSKASACAGVNLDSNNITCPTSNGLTNAVKVILNVLSIIIGVVAVIMVMVGGFRYVVSGGDPAGTNSAKNTILYALLGLIIAGLAQFLVHFVFNRVASCPSGYTLKGNPPTCQK